MAPDPVVSPEQDLAVAQNLAAVKARIAAAAKACGREPGAVSLVAVSKTQPASAVAAALAAGQLVFGENRVQEAAEKYPALKARQDALRLHLIGPLQTNKVRDAAMAAALHGTPGRAIILQQPMVVEKRDEILRGEVQHLAGRC